MGALQARRCAGGACSQAHHRGTLFRGRQGQVRLLGPPTWNPGGRRRHLLQLGFSHCAQFSCTITGSSGAAMARPAAAAARPAGRARGAGRCESGELPPRQGREAQAAAGSSAKRGSHRLAAPGEAAVGYGRRCPRLPCPGLAGAPDRRGQLLMRPRCSLGAPSRCGGGKEPAAAARRSMGGPAARSRCRARCC